MGDTDVKSDNNIIPIIFFVVICNRKIKTEWYYNLSLVASIFSIPTYSKLLPSYLNDFHSNYHYESKLERKTKQI